MEISLDKVKSRSDPYQLFLDSIRSPATLRRYKNHLHTFLKLIPNQLYTDTLQKTPKDRELITLAKFFVELARKDMDLASDVIATFIKEDRKRVTLGEISSQTIPNHIKPIKVLLDANRVPIHWKSLHKLLPRREAKSKDRAYTKKEIQKMLEVTNDITDKVIILLFSSGVPTVQVLFAPKPEPSVTELFTRGRYFSISLNELTVFHTSSADALIVPLTETLVISFKQFSVN